MALADLVSPPVHVHQLLTDWQLASWSADLALAGQLGATGAYLWGVVRLRARGRRWQPTRTAAFLAGVAVLVIAIDSGLASYDDSVFTAHVLQHLALMMVAPPLLSLGAPMTLALQASGPRLQRRLLRLLRSRPARLATDPVVAAGLYYSSMWVDLQSSFYPYSLDHPLVHDASHLVMFVLGCLFWWPLVGSDRLPHRPGPALRMGAMAVGMPFEAFLGIALMSTRDPVAPQHSLADTHAGGAVFWVGAMAIMFVGALVIGLAWMRQQDRAAARADRRVAIGADRSGAEARREDAWAAEWVRRTGGVPTIGSAVARTTPPRPQEGA
jgi:putative membrane protein